MDCECHEWYHVDEIGEWFHSLVLQSPFFGL